MERLTRTTRLSLPAAAALIAAAATATPASAATRCGNIALGKNNGNIALNVQVRGTSCAAAKRALRGNLLNQGFSVRITARNVSSACGGERYKATKAARVIAFTVNEC